MLPPSVAVARVDRRALGGLERPPGERPHRHRDPGRPRRRGADLLEALAGLLGHQAHGRELAHAALAGPHGGGRVALGELDRVVALLDAQLDVLRRDVLAQAGEALALARARDAAVAPPSTAPRQRARPERRGRPPRAARVRVAEAERVRGLGTRERARQLGSLEHAVAGDLTRREGRRGQLGEREVAALGVVGGAAAGLGDSEVAGELPPDTTSRSQPIVRPSPSSAPGAPSTTPQSWLRPRASRTVAPFSTSTPWPARCRAGPPAPSGRRSATHATSTPASSSASAAPMPRSSTVATTARVPGWTAYRATRRRAPPESITPGRSLPGKTSGCSIAPVA